MIATYRLQLTPLFGFAQARELLPYLRELGVSHVYLSPITEARMGSTHGYDVVDHNAVREDFGGVFQLQLFLAAARQYKLKVILDVVPNHAGIGPQNERWQDVLCYGPHSPFACYFDIDWHPHKHELHNKVLLPFLGQPYGAVMRAGDIDVTYENGRLWAEYYEHRFALAPPSYSVYLNLIEAHLPGSLRPDVKAVAHGFAVWREPDRARAEELKKRLAQCLPLDVAAQAWAKALATVDIQDMHGILEAQYWRLAHWRTAGHEVNYRRFFEINDLIALRMDDPKVFASTHRLVHELLCDDVIAGLRIDHVDGLYAPQAYLERLRTLGAKAIWVEKILARDEHMPDSWPVQGTTGYEFAADVCAAFTLPAAKPNLARLYRRYVADGVCFADEVYRSKRLIMVHSLAGELQRLAHGLDRLSEADWHTRDYTLQSLREALVEIIACLPRYRTYLPHAAQEAREVLAAAVHSARVRNVASNAGIYDFVCDMLLDETQDNADHRAWVARFQQYTAPVMAKGVEDTALYRFTQLVGLNEVGTDPTEMGMAPDRWHAAAEHRARHWPQSLLATSTHDSKRGEDLRMRLLVLSELTMEWSALVRGLHRVTQCYRSAHGPSRHDIYMLLQTMAALWDQRHDDLEARLQAYALKAAREAKRHTSWANPHPQYETCLRLFIAGTLRDAHVDALMQPFSRQLVQYGFKNSLSQLILKATSPGVSDFYQGCEGLDLALVDPDNRRPVDFEVRQRLLAAMTPLVQKPSLQAVAALLRDDLLGAKFYFTARLLRLRGLLPEFQGDKYQALEVRGSGTGDALAFARGEILIFVPRYFTKRAAAGGWGDTEVEVPSALAHTMCTELLSGAPVPVDHSLRPGALPLEWGVLAAGGRA